MKNKWILIGILIIVLLPIIVNSYMLIPSHSFDRGSTDAWISFFGSFYGGIIGGLATIIGIWLTLKYTKEKDESEKKRSVLPYLQVVDDTKRVDCLSYTVRSEITPNSIKNSNLKIQNVGLGTAIDITFNFHEEEYMRINKPGKIINIPVNESQSIYIVIPILGNRYRQEITFFDRIHDSMAIKEVTSPKLDIS